MVNRMINNKLAIHGGDKIIKNPFVKYNSLGAEEVEAARKVVESGVLSQFIGADDKDFLGGEKVKEFEELCKNYFNVKHVVSVNSWTSGLIAAVGAIGIEPGDEVIVPTWTMCACPTSIVHWNAIPVFADIESETFNINPDSIIKNITYKTKAIMAVDIFGHPSNMKVIREIADKYNLKVISDAAQSPGSKYFNSYTGTLGDIGGYSLNYHKHIHTGEGGILVTNDDLLAERLRLIRNHGEAAVNGYDIKNIENIIGYNFRLGEIECAIGIEQLKKLKDLVDSRIRIANTISSELKHLDGLQLPIVKENCTHVYYSYSMKINITEIGVERSQIANALAAEGLDGVAEGYANLHMLPMYQKKIAYGSSGFPWNSELSRKDVNYNKGICPIAEELHDNSLLSIEMCMHQLNDHDLELLIKAFKKVWGNLDKLK